MVMPASPDTGKSTRSYILQYQTGGRGALTKRYTIGKHASPQTADGARERSRAEGTR